MVGTYIRERRTKAGLSLRTVADSLGVSIPFLSDVERGNRTLTVDRWTAVRDTIPGVKLSELARAAVDAGPVNVDASSAPEKVRAAIAGVLADAAERRAA